MLKKKKEKQEIFALFLTHSLFPRILLLLSLSRQYLAFSCLCEEKTMENEVMVLMVVVEDSHSLRSGRKSPHPYGLGLGFGYG